MRSTLIAVAALVLLLGAGYAALPWMVSTFLLPRIAEDAGLDAIDVEMGYPGLNSLHLSRLYLEAAPIQLTANDIEVSYDFAGLRSGRLRSVVAEELALVVAAAAADVATVAGDSVEQLAPPAETLAVDSLLAQIPADRLRVEHLELGLPAKDFAARGTLSLDTAGLEAQLIGVRPDIARDLNATFRMSSAGTFQILVEDPDPDAPSSIHLTAEPEGEVLAVEGAFSITGYALELIQEAIGLPAGTGLISGELSTSAPWPLADLPRWQTLEATASLSADWTLASPALELNGISAELTLRDGAITIVPVGSTKFSTDGLNLNGTFSGGTFSYHDGVVSSEDARLALSAESSGLNGEADLHTIRTTVTPPLDTALSASVRLRADTTPVQGLVNATLTGADRNYQGQFDFDGKADASTLLDLPELRLQDYPLQLSGTYSLRGDNLDAEANLSARSIRGLPLTIKHDLQKGRGSLSFSHDQTIREPLLVQLLPGWQAPYDLDSGRLAMSGTFNWDEALNGSFELRPQTLAAHYDDYTLFDAAGTLSFQLADSTLRLLPSNLSVEAVDIGLPITNLDLTVSGTLNTLSVSDATAELLGGNASTNAFDYQVESGSADFIVTLTDIDLSEILSLEGDKVSGTGRLSGTIPVSLRDNNLHIEGGEITAGIPGLIALSPALTAGITQPGLDIAFKALENFNYDALKVNVNYDDSGDMQLGVRLEGRNPDLEGGRPVHFNLNISENIPVLLQSLRLQDNFTKTIERRVLQ